MPVESTSQSHHSPLTVPAIETGAGDGWRTWICGGVQVADRLIGGATVPQRVDRSCVEPLPPYCQVEELFVDAGDVHAWPESLLRRLG